MSSFELIKNKLLLVAKHESFVQFSPPQLVEYQRETDKFMVEYLDSLDVLELFELYQLQFFLNLMTKNDTEAKVVLDIIINQFELEIKQSQRVRLLKSIYYEAIGEQSEAEASLGSNPNEMRLSRRLCSFSRNKDYPSNLNFYLNLQPSDTLGWSELAEKYHRLGAYDKAVFAYQEILLQEPFAYPIFYKIGLNYYYLFLQQYELLKGGSKAKLQELQDILINCRDNYLRSIEICDVCVKSWLGLSIIGNIVQDPKFNRINFDTEYIKQNDQLLELSQKKLQQLADEDLKSQLKK